MIPQLNSKHRKTLAILLEGQPTIMRWEDLEGLLISLGAEFVYGRVATRGRLGNYTLNFHARRTKKLHRGTLHCVAQVIGSTSKTARRERRERISRRFDRDGLW